MFMHCSFLPAEDKHFSAWLAPRQAGLRAIIQFIFFLSISFLDFRCRRRGKFFLSISLLASWRLDIVSKTRMWTNTYPCSLHSPADRISFLIAFMHVFVQCLVQRVWLFCRLFPKYHCCISCHVGLTQPC